jgi:hypothetical protein
MPPRRNFKTTGRWHKKSGRTEQSGYQFKIQPNLQECPVKHLCTARPAGRESIDQYAQELKKITNAIRKPNYTERQEINEHIFGT